MATEAEIDALLAQFEKQLDEGKSIKALLAKAAKMGVAVQVGDQPGELEMDEVSVVVTREDMDQFDTYVKEVDTMMGMRLNRLAIVSLAESQAVTAAIANMTNQAQFASEMEATPDYKKALATAFLGTWKQQAQTATKKAMSAMGLPDVATPIFKFIDTLEAEHARALAAASDKSVKDFLNNALTGVVKTLSKRIMALGLDSDVAKACKEAAQEAAMGFWEDDKKSGDKKRDGRLVEFCDKLQAALAAGLNIQKLDVAAKHKAALGALIKGLTAKGYIDFGVVSIDTEVVEVKGGSALKQKGGPKFEDGKVPKLTGTAKNDRLATAINEYLKAIGGSVSGLDIEKRVHFKFYIAGTGMFAWFNGHTMDGHAKWTKGFPPGIEIDMSELLAYHKKEIPKQYFDYTHKAFSGVANKLDSKTVTA